MNTLQEKLDAYTAVFKQASQNWLNEEKQKMKASMNSFLVEKIEGAEKSLKKAEKNHIESFENQMRDLEEKKQKEQNPHMVSLFEGEEEFIKKEFESSMKFSKESWQTFIENCKKQIC